MRLSMGPRSSTAPSRRLKRVVFRTALPYVLAYTVRNNFCVFWEIAALIRMHAEDPEVRRHIAVVPNKLFNGYPYPGGGLRDG